MFNVHEIYLIYNKGADMRGLFKSLLIIILTIGLYAGENTNSIISVVGMKDKSCAEKITKAALTLTKHAKRKKVTRDDILLAIKYF